MLLNSQNISHGIVQMVLWYCKASEDNDRNAHIVSSMVLNCMMHMQRLTGNNAEMVTYLNHEHGMSDNICLASLTHGT